MASREEEELIGLRPSDREPGGRFGGASDNLDLVDNGGAGLEIENLEDDLADPVEVDQDPFLERATDHDDYPGFPGFGDASKTFEQEEGLEPEDENAEEAGDQVLSDEFAERMQQHADAAVDVTGAPVSDLAQHAQIADAKHIQQTIIAPYMRVNPVTASRGLLGGRATCPIGSPPIQVIHWEGEDVEALPTTISVYPVGDGQLISTGGGSSTVFKQVSFVRITWGTRDGVQTADIDVGTGIQFTVVASVVYVSVGNSVDQLGNPITSTPASVSASLGFYTTNKPAPLTFTNYILLDAGATVPCARPPFASHVYFDRFKTTEAWTLFFSPIFNAPLLSAYVRVVDMGTYLIEPVKLANDIANVIVRNDGVTGPRNARLMWGLYF